MSTNYQCDAWIVEDVHDSSPESVFLLNIFAQVNPYDSTEEVDEIIGSSAPTMMHQFLVKRDHLIGNNTSWSTIGTMLTKMNLPLYVHPMMILKIMECVQGSLYMNNMIIPIMVHLRTTRSMDAEVSEDFMEPLGSQGLSKSSTKTLMTLKIEGCSKQCVICLEDILGGTEATSMPCFHLYHGNCIQKWLERSNLCPLCRFQVPENI